MGVTLAVYAAICRETGDRSPSRARPSSTTGSPTSPTRGSWPALLWSRPTATAPTSRSTSSTATNSGGGGCGPHRRRSRGRGGGIPGSTTPLVEQMADAARCGMGSSRSRFGSAPIEELGVVVALRRRPRPTIETFTDMTKSRGARLPGLPPHRRHLPRHLRPPARGADRPSEALGGDRLGLGRRLALRHEVRRCDLQVVVEGPLG